MISQAPAQYHHVGPVRAQQQPEHLERAGCLLVPSQQQPCWHCPTFGYAHVMDDDSCFVVCTSLSPNFTTIESQGFPNLFLHTMPLFSSSYLLRPLALLAFGLVLFGPAIAQNSAARLPFGKPFLLQEGIAMVGSVAYNPTTSAISSTAGTGVALLSGAAGGANLLSIIPQHEDADLEFDVMIGPNTKGALYFQGQYFFDLSAGKDFASLGSVGVGSKVQPLQQVAKAPGLWQHLSIRFAQASLVPRPGMARIVQATLGSARILKGASFPSGGNPMAGAPKGIYFVCTAGQLALRNIAYRASDPSFFPSLSGVRYKVYEGAFDGFPAASEPVAQEGTIEGKIDYRINPLGTDFAFVVQGNVIMPKAGRYTIEILAGGGAIMVANGDTIIKRNYKQSVWSSVSAAKEIGRAHV